MTKTVERPTPLQESIIKEYHSPDNKESAYLSVNPDGTYSMLTYRTARTKKPQKMLGTSKTELNYRVDQEYESYVKYAKMDYERREADRIRYEKEAKEFKENLKVGSILSYTWGWEQTNWQFYQVVELKGKSTVVIRELNQDAGPEEGFMTNKTKPIKDSFCTERTITKRLNKKYGWLNMNHGLAKLWDGKEKTATHYA
jgi:hypothetical protein